MEPLDSYLAALRDWHVRQQNAKLVVEVDEAPIRRGDRDSIVDEAVLDLQAKKA